MNLSLTALRMRSLRARVGLLCGVVASCAAAVVLAAGWLASPNSAAAAGVAAAICLIGGIAALWISDACGTPRVLQGMLLAMAVRMGLPLGLGMAIYLRGGVLADAGFLVYLLIFYPLVLTVETYLSLPSSRTTSPSHIS